MARPPIVIKIGTNVLTQSDGTPDRSVMAALVADSAAAVRAGCQILIVSSGAMGFGRSSITNRPLPQVQTDSVASRQLFAAIGQPALMRAYAELFGQHGLTVAQVLATKQDFRDRQHYLNMRRCFEVLLHHHIVPIVNENDAVAVSELMFTDNDELAGLVATMLNAERLIILTSVDGVFTGDPTDPTSTLLIEVELDGSVPKIATVGPSSFGRGGMQSKLALAKRLARLGIGVHIAHGKQPGILTAIVAGESVGTVIRPASRPSNVKRWLGVSDTYAQAVVTVNAGAAERLRTNATSLLPVGITTIDGHCEKGDIVRIVTQVGQTLGVGRAEYSSDVLKGKLGQRGQRPFIHANYLVRSNHD